MLISGSPISSWATNKEPLQLAKKQASLLNCSTETTEILVDCIKKVSPKDIISTYSGLLEWHTEGTFQAPVVETDAEEERFLIKDPLASLAEGDVADVPIFIGTTKDEMIGRAFSE